MSISKRQRLEATLAGKAVDRPAIAFWRHFYDQERTVEGLVDAMVAFQRRFDWDFLKINPRACYHFQDWGNRYEFSPDGRDAPRCVRRCIVQPADWARLETLDPSRGVIGEHVQAVRLIRERLGPDLPMIMTVFSPLSIAAELAGDEALAEQMAARPDLVHAGLNTIAETFAGVIDAFFDAGVDGIFYATRGWGSRDRLSESQYDAFSRSYDQRLMERMQRRGWFNLLHVCGSNNLLLHVLELPTHALNWDATDPTNPSLADVAGQCDRTLVGGVDADRLAAEGPGEWLEGQLGRLAADTGKLRWVVGGGCTAPAGIADQALDAVRQAVERL